MSGSLGIAALLGQGLTSTLGSGLVSPLTPAKSGSSLLIGLAWGFPLDEAPPGAVANDVLGISNLTANNGPGGTAAKINDGRLFVAANSQSLTSASNSNLAMTANTPFTIAGWLGNFQGSGTPGILGKWTSPNFEYVVVIESNGTINFEVCSGVSAAGLTKVSSGVVPANGSTHHICCRYDLAKIYIAIDGGTEVSTAFTGPVWSGGAPFGLAEWNGSNFLSAWLDEWYGWKRDLGPGAAALLYNGGAGVTYPFVGVP